MVLNKLFYHILSCTQAVNTHKNVDEAADGAKEMLQELLLTMEDSASAAGYTDAMIDNISKSMALVSREYISQYLIWYVSPIESEQMYY